MFKKASISVGILSLLWLLSGCVQNDVPLIKNKTKNLWADQTNVDDVDISDLEENLTETETVMTEDETEIGSDTQEMTKRIPFPASEYAYLQRTGKGTIKGKIYILGANEEAILGTATRLYLNPLTSYSEQWYKESYLGGQKMEKADARLFNYLKFTASNAKGEFSFYGVPSGSYYLIGSVKCGEECGYSRIKNIRIAKEVSVYGNEILSQDLSRKIE